MKKINILTFVIASIVCGLFLLPAFIGAWALDEGTAGDSILAIILSKLFLILRFPTHTLFWSTFSNSGTGLYFIGLILNCIFYGFIVERIISIFRMTVKVE